MPQNISVVIIDSNAESLNNYCQVRRQKIVIASEVARQSRSKLGDSSLCSEEAPQSRLCNEIATVETTSQ
jgi:hypothetical protein